jgi:hypothetical protein
MDAQGDTFVKLRDLLWRAPFAFCVVYTNKVTEPNERLRWIKALSPDKKTHEEYNQLAATYLELALDCYERSRVLILKEVPSEPDSPSEVWNGLRLVSDPAKAEYPANAQGQRWWHVVIAAGATRDAGYVIIGRIAAKAENEVHDCIARIQDIMAEAENGTGP